MCVNHESLRMISYCRITMLLSGLTGAPLCTDICLAGFHFQSFSV